MSVQIFKKLRQAARFSLSEWVYLAIAVKELFVARVRHRFQPMGQILRELQEAGPPSRRRAEVDLARLSWAIAAAAPRVPWRSDCLLRVMAANRWLRRSRLPSEFFLGVQKDDQRGFAAHAWLRCNGNMISGGQGEEFATLIHPKSDAT